MDEVTWVVKNPERNAYYTFSDAEWGVIELFDGSRTRPEIVDEYNRVHPGANVDRSFVVEYEEMLRAIELLEQSVAERNLRLLQSARTSRQRAADAKSDGFNPFFIMFHVLNPDRFLDRTVRWVGWLWNPAVVLLWSIAAVWTVGVFALHFGEIWTATYELYAFLRKPLVDAIEFFAILCVIGGIHEFGHAYAVKRYGGEVRDIGLALLYFTPAFYCDTTDSLLFENKWHKLWVTTAGIYIEGFICSAATALWVMSYPDTLLHDLAYKTMLFTGVSTIFFNINPLIKIDGYYALANYLEIPELREEAFRFIGAIVQNRLLRLPVPVPTVSRRKRRIYWTYGVLALGYQCVMIRFIGGLFFNLYSRYFPDVAVVLLVITLYRVFRKRVRLVTRTVRLFYLDKKELMMAQRSRIAIAAAAVAALAILLVPWTHRIVASEGVLKPLSTARIEAPEDGRIAQVMTREGDRVSPGQELFRLSAADADADVAHWTTEKHRASEARVSATNEDAPTAAYEAAAREVSADSALRQEESRRDRLTLRSPIAGTVLTPRIEDLGMRFVASGSLLAEIGDCRTLVADVEVSERLLDDLSPGASVRAYLPQSPMSTASGRLVRVSPATADQPHTAAGLAESALPLERPDRFVARIAFDNADGRLRPGDLARVRIVAGRASLLGKAARLLRRWSQTVVW